MVLNLQEELNKQRSKEQFKLTNNSSNQKELDLLKDKIDNIEKDCNFLIAINNEELKSYKENFSSFIFSSKKLSQNMQESFIAIKKHFLPLEQMLIDKNASNSVNSDLIIRDKIFEKIENEFYKFESLISQNQAASSNSANQAIKDKSNNEGLDDYAKLNNTNFNNKDYKNYLSKNNKDDENLIINADLFENNRISLLASKQKNKEITEMLNKLELKNKLLEEQVEVLKYNYNSELKQKFAAAEENRTSLSNSVYAVNPNSNSNNACDSDEAEKLKSELLILKEKNEETEATLDYVKKLNKDLETKNNLLEEELVKIKKSIKAANERLIDYDVLKQKFDGMEKEVKYKKSIITYLENILKINKSKNYFFFK